MTPQLRQQAGTVDWVADVLGLNATTRRGITTALGDCEAATGTPCGVWGLELYHDGTGRVDVSTLVMHPARHDISFSGFVLSPSRFDVWEYDLAGGACVRLAGVFHQPTAVAMPAALAALGSPLLVSHLTGRNGQVRLLLPVPDAPFLCRLVDTVRTLGPPDMPADRLRRATPFVQDRTTLRVGVEYEPERGHLSARLGVEVFLDPTGHEVLATLRTLGVSDADVGDLRRLAASLPVAREWCRRIPGLPAVALDRTVDAIGFVHFSVSWSGADARLKSYLMVTSHATDGR